MIDTKTLRAFEVEIRKDIPDFKVAFKDQSKLMRVLGFLAYPFNDRFMTSFTTTLGNTVYFTNQDDYEKNPEPKFRTLAHEYVHLWDTKRNGLWFQLSYVFPQVLALIPLMVYAGMCWPHLWLVLLPAVGYLLGALAARLWRPLFWGALSLFVGATVALTWALISGWPLIALAVALVCCAPWHAPWRVKWELRGYSMNVALSWWMYGTYKPTFREALVQNFVGPSYFFMSWSRKLVESSLDAANEQAKSDTLQGLPPYRRVHEFLYERSLLRR